MMARSEAPHEDRPASGSIVALSVLLGIVALAGLSGSVAGAVALLFFVDNFVWGSPGAWRSLSLLAGTLLIGGVALWALLWLKPWPARGEPVSPATRRSMLLSGWGGLLGIPAGVALAYGTVRSDGPLGMFSNSPVSRGIAVIVITSWLLSMAISWWWYFGTDEHERRAYDFGSLAGCALFITVTPVWWIAARAGLLPQPDAMLLWCATAVVIMGGWFWRRFF